VADKKGGRGEGKGTISKQEAVRRALAELGHDAKPTVIKGFVKDRFGIEMGTDHISTAKGEALRKARLQGTAAPARPAVQPSVARQAEPVRATPAPPAPAAPPSPAGGAGGQAAIALEDILAVKDLVVRLGAGPLRALVDAFAR
jgi:hypothetical protein